MLKKLLIDLKWIFRKLTEPRSTEAVEIKSMGSIRHPEDGLYIAMIDKKRNEFYIKMEPDQAATFAYDILNWVGTGNGSDDDPWDGDFEDEYYED